MPIPDLRELIDVLSVIRANARALAQEQSEAILAVHPTHRQSAENLLHYVALRRRDLRTLQVQLSELGLSSLGRCESHVLATIDSVLRALRGLAGVPDEGAADATILASEGKALLRASTENLLGPQPPHRDVRILVTAPSELARDPALAAAFVTGGMDALRVNCAHDDEPTWEAMIRNARQAAHAANSPLQILMDLPGPKLRTGPMAAGPKVVKIRPVRDALGSVVRPARVLLRDEREAVSTSSPQCDAELPVDGNWLTRLAKDRVIELVDTRGKTRRMDVVAIGPGWAEAKLTRTAYVATGTLLGTLDNHGGADGELHIDWCPVGELPEVPTSILLHPGDHLEVAATGNPGERTVSCTLPEVFAFVREGERVLFDDGKIAGTIVKRDDAAFVVRIDRTAPGGAKLRADKGINLPDTRFELPGLTADDLRILPFVAAHADVLALSFLDEPSDVTDLLNALASTPGGDRLGIVLKIETRRAFEQLPLVLLEALRWRRVGVMIARGDLAVECGFERLAEVQEEILWLCEAAHVPVIWATQVLETLAKTGMPSRAEITDAAMAERAECVMLNKGPHLVSALRTLDDILQRMQAHQDKKRQTFRSLAISDLRPR